MCKTMAPYRNLYADHYPPGVPTLRDIGVELELLVLDARNHQPLDLTLLFDYLVQSEGWKAVYDPSSQRPVEITEPDTERVLSLECGQGVLEVIFPPAQTVTEIEKRHDEFLSWLCTHIDALGGVVLGYGIMPNRYKGPLSPKSRYPILNDQIGGRLEQFGISASTHVSVQAGREEIIPLVNALNRAAAALIALTANSWSPYYDGLLVSREVLWELLPENRVLIPPREFKSLADYLEVLGSYPLLFEPHEGDYRKPDPACCLREYLCGCNYTPEASTEKILAIQEGSTWFYVRPRAAGNGRTNATVEIRFACAQPRATYLAPVALALGLVEAWPEVAQAVRARNASRNDWVTLRQACARYGLDAVSANNGTGVEAFPLVRDLLEIANTGLRRREQGEERFLGPLKEILLSRQTSAQRAHGAWQNGGIAALCRTMDFRRS